MDFIKGVNFATFPRRGVLSTPEAAAELDTLCQTLAPNWLFLTVSGAQKHPHCEQIDFTGAYTPSDAELRAMIRRAHRLGLRVALKAAVNCLDGTWRAFVSFFDVDVPSEPTWRNWFASYTAFQLHYARLAQEEGCEMFIPGCEMVMAERREQEWRALIAQIRGAYGGLLSYNCDKYQEDRLTWWDCVDVLSSSGYYPSGAWDAQLDRIERVVRAQGKPFFFAEIGCMCTRGTSQRPNDWTLQGAYDPQEQAAWYGEMLDKTLARPFVGGYALWDWGVYAKQPEDRYYDLRGTPALPLIRRAFAAR